MPATNPIRYNFQTGTLGASMNSTQTSINLGAVPAFPTLQSSNGDYVPITLVNATALTNSEIVYATVFTAGNSTAGILRGQESTRGGGNSASFPAAATWEHSPMAVDQVAPNALTIGGNTTGTSTVLSAGTITLAGGNNVTLSQSGNAITVSAQNNAVSFYPYSPSSTVMSNMLYSGSVGAAAASTATTVSLWMMPMALDTPLVYNEIRIPALISATTTNTTILISMTAGLSLGIYTQNGATLSLLSSFSNQQVLTMNSTNTSGSGTVAWRASYGGSATQNTTAVTVSTASNTAGGYWTAITGSKMVPLMTGASQSLRESQYFLAVAASWSTAGQNGTAASLWYQSLGQQTAVQLTHLQDQGLTATGGTTGIYPFLGLASTILQSNTVWPNSLATSQISTSSNNASFINRSLYVHFVNRTT